MAKDRGQHALSEALALIRPELDRREECERQVLLAVEVIKAGFSPGRGSPAVERGRLRRLAAKLKAVELLGADTLWPDFIDDAKRQRLAIEEYASKLDRWKSKPRSEARHFAVHEAHKLLQTFGSRRPTVTKGGPWHDLTAILHKAAGGSRNADLYDYVRGYRLDRKQRLPEAASSSLEDFGPVLPRDEKRDRFFEEMYKLYTTVRLTLGMGELTNNEPKITAEQAALLTELMDAKGISWEQLRALLMHLRPRL
jgi:hypothetical protein